MSRTGKKPIPIPGGVTVEFEGELLRVKGPKGELRKQIHPKVAVKIENDHVLVSIQENDKATRSLHGLSRALIANMVTGVSRGFERVLEIVGVGYRAELSGRTAVLHLGYSHPVNFELPAGIDANIERTKITLTGIDKELLGRTAAKIRSFRAPEPYKGKGVKYAEETIRRKAGKTGAK
ncbi:MAG: 50S ribosomal protein L6 [Deltaproteobacteria bacterium]|nr:50S ribosomal protein L6 [Deltaproteobacteria bacterium]